MASDVFLYRKDRRWQKFSKIDEISLTGAQASYSTVTGNATTNVVTITGATITDGDTILFNQLTGGSGLSTGTNYYAINSSGETCKLATTPGGGAIDFTTAITAGVAIVSNAEIFVWSGEFRDLFSDESEMLAAPTSAGPAPDNYIPGSFTGAAALLPNSPLKLELTSATTSPPAKVYSAYTTEVTASVSDEKNHYPLRQTALKKTHWRFRQANSTTPTYLYAVWMDGDQISNNPPETV